MKFSMNGFRRNLSQEVSELKREVVYILKGGEIDKEDLINAMNTVICASNCLNCVSIPDDPDFVEMGDLELDILDNEDDYDY